MKANINNTHQKCRSRLVLPNLSTNHLGGPQITAPHPQSFWLCPISCISNKTWMVLICFPTLSSLDFATLKIWVWQKVYWSSENLRVCQVDHRTSFKSSHFKRNGEGSKYDWENNGHQRCPKPTIWNLISRFCRSDYVKDLEMGRLW